MRKLIALLVFVSLFTVACGGGGKFTVDVEEAPTYKDGESSPIVFSLSDGDELITGADMSATLEMARMDHGTIEVIFTDVGDGTYSGEVELPMAGEWIANVIINVDGKEVEKTVTFDVNEG